jgi:hypothetical protein
MIVCGGLTLFRRASSPLSRERRPDLRRLAKSPMGANGRITLSAALLVGAGVLVAACGGTGTAAASSGCCLSAQREEKLAIRSGTAANGSSA